MAFSDRPSSSGAPEPAQNPPPHPGRHARTHHSIWVLVAPVVAVLAVLAGLGVFLARQASQPLAPPTQTAAQATPAAHASAAAATKKAIASCRQAWNAQGPALQAADRSLAQWQTHVQAMNALVAGRISLAQASKFWARTRIGAKRRAHLFERVYDPLRRDPPACTLPAATPATGSTAATLTACAQGVRIRNQTLTAAQTAIRTWRGHIQAMEMLRTGQLSPSTATRMWIKMWHRGQRQLDDYHSKASQAAAQHC